MGHKRSENRPYDPGANHDQRDTPEELQIRRKIQFVIHHSTLLGDQDGWIDLATCREFSEFSGIPDFSLCASIDRALLGHFVTAFLARNRFAGHRVVACPGRVQRIYLRVADVGRVRIKPQVLINVAIGVGSAVFTRDL